jgi:peptide/nickel transport system permease protein
MTAATGPMRARRNLRRIGGLPRLVVQRVLLGVLTLLISSILIFAATQALPGNTALSILGQGAVPSQVAMLKQELGLNKPVVQQYLDWIGGVIHGDLGRSLATGQPVAQMLSSRLVNSGFLMLLAAILCLWIPVMIGVISAWRRDGVIDHILSIFVLTTAALPEFVIAIGLVSIFAVNVFHIFPGVAIIDASGPWHDPTALVLPVLTLAIAITPHTARIVRASMVEVLESDYVEMARLKGVPDRVLLRRHAFKNAIAPGIQTLALTLAYLAGGIVVVEYVFNYPGIGSAFVSAVETHDVPVVQAIAILIAALYVALNIIADISTILVTPRLRTPR